MAAVAEALGVAPRDLLPGPDDAPGQVDDGPPRSNPAGPELTAAEAELLEAVRGGDAARLAQALAAAVGAARNDDRTSAPVTRAEVVRLTRQRPKQPKK